MASAEECHPYHHTYGSVDTSVQHTSQNTLLPRSARCSDTSYPSTVGAPRSKATNLRDLGGGKRISWRLVALVCGLALLAGSGAAWRQSSSSFATAEASGEFFEVSSRTGIPDTETQRGKQSSDVGDDADYGAALQFTALNFYHVRDGKPGQDYPWLKDIKLIEPHRDTTLAVVDAREGFDYRWEVRAGSSSSSNGPGGVGEVQTTAKGAVTIVVLTQLDENVVVLEEVDADGKVTNRLEETVMVKYVRREIRTLTHDEREELLDAMFQLWKVRLDGGYAKELYGEDYVDVYALNQLHYKATGNITCNNFHTGMGFLVSHSLLSNTFEFSLQLVNPKLTLPYWDFTIETTAAANVAYDQKQPFTRTELLSPSFFGTSDLDDYMVKDGRWAYTEIPAANRYIGGDVYGNLRSPWSTNDRAYVSRGLGWMCQGSADDAITWPDCASHYDLTIDNNDFYSWVWSSEGGPHAPVHIWMGGHFDCDQMFSEVAALVGPYVAQQLAYLSNDHRKRLYYAGIWSCTRPASMDESPSELLSSGVCGCQGRDFTQGDDYKAVMATISYANYYLGGFSEDIQRRLAEILCSGVLNYGEQGQASSTLDPTFWPMHGTLERLWQFAVVTNQVTDFTWPDRDTTITFPDDTTFTLYLSSYEKCLGHHGSDVFPYGLISIEDDGFEVKTGIRSNPTAGNVLSNRDVMAAFDPRSNSLTYVYDTFKWDHCRPEGYDFDDAWGDTASSPRKSFYERDEPIGAMYTSFKREMAELTKEKEGKLKDNISRGE